MNQCPCTHINDLLCSGVIPRGSEQFRTYRIPPHASTLETKLPHTVQDAFARHGES